MIIKKAIVGFFILSLLGGCAQTTAFLGPMYTLGTTGNVYQAGLSYGSNQAITSLTGKSTGENIKTLLAPSKKDSEFQKLVKNRIQQTRKKLNLTNQ
tara:strand:- start:499 stop:789 length:291 start_codon:yes stop_codon:yes gene_type:complete